MAESQRYSTDVLVVGGGIAGCFAALEAKKEGAEVILVDKGYVSSSGQTPYAGTFTYCDPQKHDRQQMLNYIRFAGDYLAHMGFAELALDKSKECIEDMISYGAQFLYNEDGTLTEFGNQDGWAAAVPEPTQFPLAMRKAVLDAGATILDRVMAVELIVEDGVNVGVVGMTVTDAIPVVIAAKSVILCTGASALKPPGWPVSNLTGDGDMMAYRAGVAITGKEFVDVHNTKEPNPNCLTKNLYEVPGREKKGDKVDTTISDDSCYENGEAILRNAEGTAVHFLPNLKLGVEFEIHAGRGPVLSPGDKPGVTNGRTPLKGPVISGASQGMACHKTEGIWPAGVDCSTNLPGLYAAGDSLGTMTSGAAYTNIGIALCGSATTGKVAGEHASLYSKGCPTPKLCEEKVQAIIANVYAPMARKGGFSPDWLIAYLQNITAPYFVFFIKEESRLNSVLEQVRYAKKHIVPKLYANDDHHLRLAIEAKNMVENLEIKLLAGLERKESRGTHYREDYPTRDEENFSAFITFRQVDGEVIVEKYPLPEDWKWHEGDPRIQEFPTSF